MTKRTALYPRVGVDAAGRGVVSPAGAVAPVETLRASGLDRGLSCTLSPWRRPLAVHDPAKIVRDLAITLAVGGDCLAGIALLRVEPGLFGRVASDPTVSGAVDALSADAPRALAAISAARAQARARVWARAGRHPPDQATDAAAPLIVDLDATLVTAHSEKEQARPTFKRGYGFHPLWAFADHGATGTGEPLAVLLRPGNAGSNTAADHVSVIRDALRQLPSQRAGTRPGRRVLVRTDAAGCTHDVLTWLAAQRLSYSVGFPLPHNTEQLLARIPAAVWAPAYDADGHRVTAFATNTTRGQLADLELRHRRRARCEDRIRCAKDTGLANLPLHDFAQNQIWCAIVALACELTAWMQLLALAGHDARRWEPKRLRLRLFSAAGRLAVSGRCVVLHLRRAGRWSQLLVQVITRLRALPAPG